MIYVNKILPIFFLPVALTLIFVLAGFLLRRRALVWTGLAILWIGSMPLVGASLLRAVEGGAERTPAAAAAVGDAIVVLSLGRVVAPGFAAISEWGDADRFFGGVELFQAGKAPLLIFTGGWVPWEPEAPLEGEILKQHARAMGVPAERIMTTGRVTNTAEEATAVAALLAHTAGLTRPAPPPRVLLVTSAFHMTRARGLFERAGLVVVPFPVDFRVSERAGLSVMDFLPSAGALAQSETALREMYGRLFYRVTDAVRSLRGSTVADAMLRG